MSKKKNKIKAGDTVYYESNGNIYSAVVADVEGQRLNIDDTQFIWVRDCLEPNDPRIKNCLGEEPIDDEPFEWF